RISFLSFEYLKTDVGFELRAQHTSVEPSSQGYGSELSELSAALSAACQPAVPVSRRAWGGTSERVHCRPQRCTGCHRDRRMRRAYSGTHRGSHLTNPMHRAGAPRHRTSPLL